MNKATKLFLFSAFIAVAGIATYKFMGDTKAENSDKVEKKSSENSQQEKQNNKEEKVELSDKLNSQTVQETKKNGKTVVLFKDGTTITDQEINKEIEGIPEQLSAKMSLAEIRSFLAWKNAYKKVVTEAALRSGVTRSKEVSDLIEKRKKTVAGFMLLDDKAKELMTFDALKANYDKVWDKNFKGTKEFSLIAITTSDKSLANTIKDNAKDEASLRKILDANVAKLKQRDLDSRPQGMFPPEITTAVLKQGAKTVVGPFELKGSFMLFYVKAVNDAKKREFTEEFAEEYKKSAARDFIKEYTQTLYKKYGVKIMDVNGKVVDSFAIVEEKATDKEKEKNLVNLSKLQDDATLATYDTGKITVKDLKEFYKVDTLLDQTFISMAKQFNISVDKVVVYATKLVMDDLLLSKEVEATGYDKEQRVIDKMNEVGNMEAQHAYFKERVKVKTEDIKRAYDKFIKSIPEEDKNDNEISVKLAFYDTREDAVSALKAINSGEEKFGSVYKEKSAKKEAIDLGYVKKRGTSPDLWTLLKTGASGACIKQIVEMDGSQFGMDGKNYVLIYIADRRPVQLPSLSNEAERPYFQRLAERDKAVDLARTILVNGIQSIENKKMEELIKQNPEYVNRMISVLMGYAG